MFTINHKWLCEYADELERRGLRMPFETISREDRLNEEIVDTLARMGCSRLWIGAESGSQRVLDAMERRTDAERVRDMVHLLQRHGIEVGMFIMLGYEGEELADLEATVEHLKAAGPDMFLTTVAYPIKGTPYYAVGRRPRRRRGAPGTEGSDRDLTVLGRHSPRLPLRHALDGQRGRASTRPRTDSGRAVRAAGWPRPSSAPRSAGWAMRAERETRNDAAARDDRRDGR